MISAFRKVANHAFDVFSDVADFGVLGCLYLHEGGFDEFGKPTGNLRFTNARRTFHNDVFRRNLFANFRREHGSSITVAKGDGDRAFGVVLTDDIFV